MHHTDLDFDVTTGIRFHPIEILVSILIKFAVISILGRSNACSNNLRNFVERNVDVQSRKY